MTTTARDALTQLRKKLAPGDGDNRLVPLIAAGKAPHSVLAGIAAEQSHVVASDLRSLLTLATRTTTNAPACDFFNMLAHGERMAQRKLTGYAAACGLDEAALAKYEPLGGCQAYPSYVARLSLEGDPASAILAMVANFEEWSGYCTSVAQALRAHYDFDDKACEFFDFFAAPAPELEEQALLAVQTFLDAGQTAAKADRYGRLLREYELMFWNSLLPPT